MKSRRNSTIFLVIWSILFIGIVITFIFLLGIKKPEDTVVKVYENGLDELNLEYDEDNKQYIVYVGSEDKGTLKQYYVKLEDAYVIPSTENEVHFEITKSGKYKLYFFIKWEVEE